MKFEVKTINEMKKREKINFPNYEVTLEKWIKINDELVPLVGYGIATCSEEDQFNKNFGKELAETRAKINMLKYYEALLIQYTKQPEWRKKVKKKEDFKIHKFDLDIENIIKEIDNSLICIDGKLYELKPFNKG